MIMIKCTLVFMRHLTIRYDDFDSIDKAIYTVNAQLGECWAYPICLVFQKNGHLIMSGEHLAALTLDMGY